MIVLRPAAIFSDCRVSCLGLDYEMGGMRWVGKSSSEVGSGRVGRDGTAREGGSCAVQHKSK